MYIHRLKKPRMSSPQRNEEQKTHSSQGRFAYPRIPRSGSLILARCTASTLSGIHRICMLDDHGQIARKGKANHEGISHRKERHRRGPTWSLVAKGEEKEIEWRIGRMIDVRVPSTLIYFPVGQTQVLPLNVLPDAQLEQVVASGARGVTRKTLISFHVLARRTNDVTTSAAHTYSLSEGMSCIVGPRTRASGRRKSETSKDYGMRNDTQYPEGGMVNVPADSEQPSIHEPPFLNLRSGQARALLVGWKPLSKLTDVSAAIADHGTSSSRWDRSRGKENDEIILVSCVGGKEPLAGNCAGEADEVNAPHVLLTGKCCERALSVREAEESKRAYAVSEDPILPTQGKSAPRMREGLENLSNDEGRWGTNSPRALSPVSALPPPGDTYIRQ
ncbi:hypothetical protein R3P38DRAFT_2776027 [Favolaschia claudopus]|uniref:Uncharacterized protein n=1 Tax=Favolaschia claudopus TaxID=2862362 RepID=A0AAW0BP03_9AGAR